VMALMVAVGTLMVSTVRFPSSKQRLSKGIVVVIAAAVLLLIILRERFFVLFFLLYIGATLLLNIAWRTGWRGVAPPVIYADEEEV
jgi:CDP-diacylglycerol--serine O-phosphatidyltransferase